MSCILTNIEYDGKSYNIATYGIYRESITAKFDTGAVETMLSLSCMLGDYDQQEEDRFKQYATNNKITPTYFNAANGGVMECYPCLC